MWRSLVAHLLWEQGVGSSNLPIPTTKALVRGLRAGGQPSDLLVARVVGRVAVEDLVATALKLPNRTKLPFSRHGKDLLERDSIPSIARTTRANSKNSLGPGAK